MSQLTALTATLKSGTELFTVNNTPTNTTVLAFWRWSGSDLLSNTQRGLLAEFIVGCDLGACSGVRSEWATYDLKTQSGITVEVKSAAYVQAWYQKRLSPISFRIAPTTAWNHETGASEGERRRQADVYVFALLAHQDKATVDPLNLDQWRFLVLATEKLSGQMGRRISLEKVKALGAVEVGFGGIGEAVQRVVGEP